MSATVDAEGPHGHYMADAPGDEEEALSALLTLINNKFDEEN